MSTTNYEYKCVQVPSTIIVDKKNKAAGLQSYQDLINREAAGGWLLDSIDSFVISVPPGCISILTGRGAENSTVKILIFRRAV